MRSTVRECRHGLWPFTERGGETRKYENVHRGYNKMAGKFISAKCPKASEAQSIEGRVNEREVD